MMGTGLFLETRPIQKTSLDSFCIGQTPKGILTVRFTVRGRNIRIIGAGKWRKWSKFYEKTRQR